MNKFTNEQLMEQYHNEINEFRKEVILNTLFEQNRKYIHHIAKKYKHEVLEHEDLAAFATVGMMKAIDSYDPTTGFKFITYASRAMHNEILMQLRKAEYKKKTVSLFESTLDNVDSEITLLDVVEDPSGAFENKVELKGLVKQVLQEAKTLLTEKEYIIVSNILAIVPKTQTQLQAELGVSQRHVGRLEKGALKKIRDFLKEREGILLQNINMVLN